MPSSWKLETTSALLSLHFHSLCSFQARYYVFQFSLILIMLPTPIWRVRQSETRYHCLDPSLFSRFISSRCVVWSNRFQQQQQQLHTLVAYIFLFAFSFRPPSKGLLLLDQLHIVSSNVLVLFTCESLLVHKVDLIKQKTRKSWMNFFLLLCL